MTAHPLALMTFLSIVEPGVIDHYITAGRDIPVRPVSLRQVSPCFRGCLRRQRLLH